MMKITIKTERSDLHSLSYAAIKAGNSQKVSDVKRCFDILRYLQKLDLSAKDLCHSKAILPLASLRDHENPKIRMEAEELFNSWMKTLYSSGKDSSLCNKAIPLNLKKPNNVTKVCSELKSKKKSDVSGMKKNEDERCQAHETGEIKQIDDKCFATKSIKAKKLSKNPRPDAQETGEIKQNLKKTGVVCESVPATSRPLQMKKKPSMKVSENPKPCPALKKNLAEMLELFEIAKKSADVANAKGLLAATAETSICVDTLSLLVSYPISSTATETRRIMERLERLTTHKDRKICNSASALLHHWRKSINDQQH